MSSEESYEKIVANNINGYIYYVNDINMYNYFNFSGYVIDSKLEELGFIMMRIRLSKTFCYINETEYVNCYCTIAYMKVEDFTKDVYKSLCCSGVNYFETRKDLNIMFNRIVGYM